MIKIDVDIDLLVYQNYQQVFQEIAENLDNQVANSKQNKVKYISNQEKYSTSSVL